MHDVSFDGRAHAQDEFLVPWTALVLGLLQEVSGRCIYGHETGSRSCWLHCMGLVASNHLRTFVFVSGEPVSEAHIQSKFGQRVLDQIRRTTSHEKQAIGFSLLYDHPVCVSCI